MNFKDYHNLNEAFDNPYKWKVDRRDGGSLIAYTFFVDDADDPYEIEASFGADRLLRI